MTEMRSTPVKPSTRETGRIAFVGAGPGDLGLLTVRAVTLLGEADVVVTDQVDRTDLLRRCAAADVTVVQAELAEDGTPLSRAARARTVVRSAKGGRRVVRLLDGDPTVFTGIAEEVAAARKAGLGVEVVPGVSAVSAVGAYAGVALGPHGIDRVHVLHATGTERGADLPAPREATGATVVVLGLPRTIAETVEHMLGIGWDADTPALAVSRATTTAQVSVETPLGKAGDALAELVLPVTLLIGEAVRNRAAMSWFETRPLFGWHVLVPRTKEQSAGVVDRLGELGAEAEVVPTISVEPPRTPQQMDKAVRGLVTGRYEWVGFTSVNAVRAVREQFAALGLDARSFSGLKIAAVGGVTATALRQWGLEPDLMPEHDQSAQGLLDVWPAFDEQLDPIDRVFLPRADIATETLVAGLQEAGWQVDDVTAYRTVRAAPPPQPVRDAIKSGGFDAVLFTSSSTVRNLVGIAGKPHASTIIACIGPKTAATAEEHGLRVDVLAPEPNAESLVDALAAFGAALRAASDSAGEVAVRPSQRSGAARRRVR